MIYVRGRVFGWCGTAQEDLLENFEREVRETEWKCVLPFCFSRMGWQLEVRHLGREALGESVGTGGLFVHMTNKLAVL